MGRAMSNSPTGSPKFANIETLSQSDEIALQTVVETVASQKSQWANTSCSARIKLLDELLESLRSVAKDWVAAGCRAKGYEIGTPPEGEEWLTGPCLVARNVRLLRDSISQIDTTGKPKLPGKPYARPDGQVVAPAFPTGLFDRILFMGFKADVWMQPDVNLDQVSETMAVAYQANQPREGSVCLVLGAGNVSSIGPMDALYKLFVENQVVVLKMNPVNEYLTEHFNIALEPLIRSGYLKIVTGGSETGKFLCEHPHIDEIHITGSDKTHDAIVYGSGAEGETQKLNRQPICKKRVTSELGNVSPVIVVPGNWSKSDISFQAQNVASMLCNNAGFNCNAVRLLVLHDQWTQKSEFLDALKKVFAGIPVRKAYYPGAADRYKRFTEHRSEVDKVGQGDSERLPWAIVRNLDPADANEICFNTEAFCCVMGETSLPGPSTSEFIANAVSYCNKNVWGSLNTSIIIHNKTRKQPAVADALDRAIADLEYGTVAINHWAGVNYGLTSTTWGAFPGHPTHDIRSGTGVVHNSYMFGRPQKTVLHGPFRPFPKPVWFSTHRNTHKLGPAFFNFQCSPSWFNLPAVLINAIG